MLLRRVLARFVDEAAFFQEVVALLLQLQYLFPPLFFRQLLLLLELPAVQFEVATSLT